MILYVQKPKVSAKKTIRINNLHSSVAGYKINLQKSVTSPIHNNELSEKKAKKK